MSSFMIGARPGRDWLEAKSYPTSDSAPLERSVGEFDGGGRYGVEIPVVNSFAELERLVELLGKYGLYVTRFNETRGSFLLSDAELNEMFQLCGDNGYGMLISLGPRPEYDIKASFYRSEFGLEMGRQVNNSDAFRACVEEALRLAELGCRGVIVYDLGVLRVLDEMRLEGALPADMVFKTSSHCMATNAFLAKIFAENGADSITLAHDLGLPMIHQIRRLNPNLPLDIPTDVYKAKGGFIRFYELAEIVQIAAPVMLKMGASVQAHPYDRVSDGITRERVDRVARGLDLLDRHLPGLSSLTPASRHYANPALGL